MSWLGKQNEKKRLKKLYEQRHKCGYLPRGAFIDKKGLYVRIYPYSTNHDNIKKYYCTLANRKTRRVLGNVEALNRGMHKKIFDVWWMVY